MQKIYIFCAVLLAGFGRLFATDLVLKPHEVSLRPGQGLEFEWALFDNGQPVASETATSTWQVVPASLGTISEDGYFIAGNQAAEGVVQLSVTLGAEQLTAKAHIVIGKPSTAEYQLIVRPEKTVLAPGERERFAALLLGSDGVAIVTTSIRWLVEPLSLGSIRQDGVFTAGLRSGEGKVVAVVNIRDRLYKGTASVIVNQPAISVIMGTVSDGLSNALANATINATRIGLPEFSRRTESDGDGAYVLDKLMPGTYIVKAEKEGFLPQYFSDAASMIAAKPIRLAVSDTVRDINFSLQQGGGISGTVRDAAAGTPIAGAHVWAVASSRGVLRFHGVTADDGTFTLTGMPDGTYVVYAKKEGYITEVYKESKRQDPPTPVLVKAPEVTSAIDFTLDLTSAITGVITSDPDGAPVRGAVVSVLPAVIAQNHRLEVTFSGSTNENGEYLIQVPTGDYLVRAAARGFAEEYYDNITDASQATTVHVPTSSHVRVDMALAPFGSLSGTVADAATGQPIANARVQMFNERRSLKRFFETTTADDGTYRFASVPADDYIVAATADHYLPEYWQEADSIQKAVAVTVRNNQATEAIAFTLNKGATIRGVVTFEPTNTTPTQAVITIYSADHRIKRISSMQDDGSWMTSGLPAGTYYAMAAAAGFVPEWFNNTATRKEAAAIDVAVAEEKTGIDFSLTRTVPLGSSISGIVKDEAQDLPLPNATVVAMPVNRPNRPRRAVSDADGRYEITGLNAGPYIILAGAKGYIAEYYDNTWSWKRAQVVRVDGTTDVTDINFALATQPMGGYMVAGRVSTRSGDPAGFALVVMQATGITQAAVICEEDGRFNLSQIPGDQYDMTASTPGYEDSSVPAAAPITVGNGHNVYDAGITMLESTVTAVETAASMPAAFSLEQNYPNPFNPTTAIRFTLPGNGRVQLRVYNVLGKVVKTLHDGIMPAGQHAITWDGTNEASERMASGIYLYRLEAQTAEGVFRKNKRMVLIK